MTNKTVINVTAYMSPHQNTVMWTSLQQYLCKITKVPKSHYDWKPHYLHISLKPIKGKDSIYTIQLSTLVSLRRRWLIGIETGGWYIWNTIYNIKLRGVNCLVFIPFYDAMFEPHKFSRVLKFISSSYLSLYCSHVQDNSMDLKCIKL